MAIVKIKQRLFGWANLMARTYSFARRSPRETLLVLRMAVWVVVISGMARVSTLPRVLSILTPHKKIKLKETEPTIIHIRLAQLIDQLLHSNVFVFTPTCWKRAAVLYRFLALNGVETRIVFGVRRETEGLLAGHAWLEVKGSPIFESSPPNFHVTYAFPAR